LSVVFEGNSQLSRRKDRAFFLKQADINSSPRFRNCHRRKLLFWLRLICVDRI
jgi:hypothetical protein